MAGPVPSEPIQSLFEHHHAALRRYVYRMVRNEADADELVQESFLRATRAFGRFRHEAEASTWLYRIATNVCLDFFRRRSARPGDGCQNRARPEGEQDEEMGDDLPDSAGLTPELLFEASEMGGCVREYVDGLPEAFRAALVLHDLEGLTTPEVGRILGWSVEKVKITVHRARRRLKGIFEQECRFYRDGRDALQWECKGRNPRTEGDGSSS